MKKCFVSLISILLAVTLLAAGKSSAADTLRITTTPEISSMAKAWAEGYTNSNPSLAVKVIVATDSRQAEEFLTRGMMGFVTSQNLKSPSVEKGWHTIVGRDIIVPVMNISNPAKEDIMKHGITTANFISIINGKPVILGSETAKSVSANYYYIKDSEMDGMISSFLGATNLSNSGTEIDDANSLIAALEKDPAAFGFCNLAMVSDLAAQAMNGKLTLVPIDRNSNGIIDATENIYTDLNQFMRGVWIGKYPRSLSTGIYAAGIERPESEDAKAFLKWVITDGQKLLADNGYSDLLIAERQKAVDQMNEARVYSAAATETKSPIAVLVVIFAGALALVILADLAFRYIKRMRTASYEPIPESDKGFSEGSVVVPKGVYFDKAHTWAFMEQDGMVKVGIDDFLQHVTGAITKVQMKKEGSEVKKGEQILSIIQNGKHLDIYAPVSGVIRELNIALEANSGLINSSPYNEGWIYRIEPSNWFRENQLLFYADKYRQYLSQEFTRLKDFVAAVLADRNPELSHVVLQDGGELREGILSQMGPEVWEDFQTKYIDPSRQIWFYELF